VIISQWSECWLWQVKSAADLFGALVIVIEGFLLWVELSIETLQIYHSYKHVGLFCVYFSSLLIKKFSPPRDVAEHMFAWFGTSQTKGKGYPMTCLCWHRGEAEV
jgi:hypothetical protein